MQSLSDQDHAAASTLHSLSSPPGDSSFNSTNFFPTSPTSPTSPIPFSFNRDANQQPQKFNDAPPIASPSPSASVTSSSQSPVATTTSTALNQSNSLPPPPIPKKKKSNLKAKGKASHQASVEKDQLAATSFEIKSEDQSSDQSNKRKKASRACVHCQKSHLTCEDARPCGRCIKRGMAESCQDGVRKKAKYLLTEEELAELNERQAAQKAEKAAAPTKGKASLSKSRASISSTSSEASSSRPRQIKRNSSNQSMLAASPVQSLPPDSSSGIGLLQESPDQNELELPSNDSAFESTLQNSISTNHAEPINSDSNGRGFSRFDPNPYTFGSEATSLEYSMLSSMLNDIDPSLIGGNGTPDWNQLSPHTHHSENSDDYRLNRYDGVAAPSGLNPASISGTNIAGTSGGEVNAEGGQGLQNQSLNGNGRFGEVSTIGSEEAMNGFTNWNGDQGNDDEINNNNPASSNISSGTRKSSRNSRSKASNNNHFLPSLTSLSTSSSSNSNSSFNASSSILPASLLSNSTSANQGAGSSSGGLNGEGSYASINEEEREPTSAALTDTQARARHASVFDPDPHSISDAVWKERVGKVYSQKIKPFPYTEGYHFLLKHCTENFEKADVLRIVRALAVFRPSLIALQMPLTEEDEIFVERSLQRTVLELEKLISFSGTPTVVWRRTCEICVVGAEFSMLTQWSREHLLGRFIYQFLDKESSINYWETFALHAFDAGRQSVMLKCTLVTPAGKSVPCSACFSIKRDIFDLPSLIVGNFLPILS